jgi:cbb3-type cytochrome oxidase maturation protein
LVSVATFFQFNYLLQSSSFIGLTINGWILIFIMLSLSITAVSMYLGAKKGGQFDDIEGIKYQMLFEEDEEDFYD